MGRIMEEELEFVLKQHALLRIENIRLRDAIEEFLEYKVEQILKEALEG